MQSLIKCLNVADLRRRARRRLPRPIFTYLDGGAEDEVTMRRNSAGFAQFALLPRVLNDVGRIDTTTEVLGQKLAWPLVVGPTGMPCLFHPDGEMAIARAAAAAGILYSLSTMASRSIEDVAAATSAPKVFQLYVFRDRGITRELIQRARAAGYVALILTVDIQVAANREGDKRSGMVIPPRFGVRSLVDFMRHPAWCWHALRKPVALANFKSHRASPGMSLLSYISEQFDPSISWQDLEWVAREWGGPIALKGLLRPDDAVRAFDHGASAVILSNHGGRQLDTAATPMDVLEETVARVAGRGEVIVDGGFRRGTDMLKAMALGASACMTGRVGLYGLASGGEAGVAHAFQLLRAEYQRGMGMLGARSRAEVTADLVKRLALPRGEDVLTG